MFLAYYPGIFAYDVEGQLAMQPGSFTNWHPLIHTLYLKLFYDGIGTGLLHNATVGIALAAAVQMIVFALQIAILPLTLRRMGVSRTGQVLASVFLMFCPSVSVMAILLTKDVFFSGFFVCVLCQTIALSLDAGWSGRPGHRILFGVCVAGLILFRNTGLYIILGFGIAAAAVWLIQKRYQTLVALICGILGAMLVSTSLMAITRAGKVVYNDPYSVPIQQIASVCTREKETMDPALRSEIEDLIPDVDQFNPYNSDPVRVWSRLMALEKSRYIQVWLRLARQYPLEMVQAFLLLTQAYWYLDDTSLVRIYHWDQGQEGYGYYQSYTADGFGVHPHSLLPGLKEACEHLFQHPDYAYLHLWPLNWLCAPATYVWLLLFCLLSALCDHNRRAGLPLWLCVLLCATLFLSPCALLRYALPLMVAAPALIAIAFYRFERTKLPSSISL